MSTVKKQLRICGNGHRYFKSSDCPVCPICESARKPAADFMNKLPAPARRALEREGIITLKQLSSYSEAELLNLHGLGPASLPVLRKILSDSGLSFRDKDRSKAT